MNKVYIIVIGVSFISGYMVSNLKLDTYKKSQEVYIKNLSESYQKKITDFESKITSLKQNNITKTITVYKTSGEKIVTNIIDKSIAKNESKKRVTEKKVDRLDVSSSLIGRTKEEMRSNSLSKYKFGIEGLQPFGVNFYSNLKLTSGVRFLSFPLFVTLQAPVNTNFYKEISFGVELELP